jgi:MYXO-CTERM domain-containing protein
MTYLQYNGNRAFQDQDVSCGEYQSRQCGINGSVCRATQNSVQLLLARVGQGDAIAPVLMWSTPSDGETVAPGFTVDAAGTDNIAVTGATLLVDGVEAGTQPGAGPFSFATDATLADGPHTLELQITDGHNVQSQMRTVTVAQAQQDPGSGSGDTGGGTDPGGGGGGSPSGASGTVGGCAIGGAGSGPTGLLGVVLGLGFVVLRRRR